MKLFKIRSSQISKIMGKVGLTEKQAEEMKTLSSRENGEGKPLTAKQAETLADLREKSQCSSLPAGCITFLKEWYAEEEGGDREELHNKEILKGIFCENEAIDFSCDMLGFSFFVKNEEHFENSFMSGTPDVITEHFILDTKCSWNLKSFHASITGKLNNDYFWQMQGYMLITGKQFAKVCYCLLDTPEEVNYGKAVSYSHIPNNRRFYAFNVERNEVAISQIQERVELCREWLKNYDIEIAGLLNG